LHTALQISLPAKPLHSKVVWLAGESTHCPKCRQADIAVGIWTVSLMHVTVRSSEPRLNSSIRPSGPQKKIILWSCISWQKETLKTSTKARQNTDSLSINWRSRNATESQLQEHAAANSFQTKKIPWSKRPRLDLQWHNSIWRASCISRARSWRQ